MVCIFVSEETSAAEDVKLFRDLEAMLSKGGWTLPAMSRTAFKDLVLMLYVHVVCIGVCGHQITHVWISRHLVCQLGD